MEKLQVEIIVQNADVAALKSEIQAKHNEVISYNEQLKEASIKQAQQDINNLTNLVFSQTHYQLFPNELSNI
jgi:chromosome segregation protein